MRSALRVAALPAIAALFVKVPSATPTVRNIPPEVVLTALFTVNAVPPKRLKEPVVVDKGATVVRVPPSLARSRLPIPVEIGEAGRVRVPVEITVNGLFTFSVGAARVR